MKLLLISGSPVDIFMKACYKMNPQVQNVSPHFPTLVSISPAIVFAPRQHVGGITPLDRLLSKEQPLDKEEEGPKEPWNPLILLDQPVPGPSGVGKRRIRKPLKYAVGSPEKQPRLGCICKNKCMTSGCSCKGANIKCYECCHLRYVNIIFKFINLRHYYY